MEAMPWCLDSWNFCPSFPNSLQLHNRELSLAGAMGTQRGGPQCPVSLHLHNGNYSPQIMPHLP